MNYYAAYLFYLEYGYWPQWYLYRPVVTPVVYETLPVYPVRRWYW